jgi:hypothetical protein
MSTKIHPFQTNFTGGELSPNLDARADLQKYQHGAKTLENVIPIAQGGSVGRPGLHFVDSISPPSATTGFPVRLIKFEFNTEQAYILAFVENHITVYANNGVVSGVDVATNYLEEELYELEVAQSADVLEIAHRNHNTKQLRRLSHTSWELIDKPLESSPMQNKTKKPSLTLTFAAATGADVTVTVSSPYWLAGDVGKILYAGTGEAIIRSITSTSQVKVDIRRSFQDVTVYTSGEWRIVGTGGGGGVFWKPLDRYQADSISLWQSSAPAHRSEDIGDHILGWNGVAVIDRVTSTQAFNGKVLVAITEKGKSNIPTFASPIWVSGDFPGCVAYFQGRLYFAASKGYPQTIWGSEVAFYNNFRSYGSLIPAHPSHRPPVVANDPISFTISDTNVIHWIAGLKVIFIGSSGGISIMTGGSLREPIKHDNIQVVNESGFGVAPRSPVIANNSLVYIQRGNRKVRNLIYDQDRDNFSPTDLTIFADHLGATAEFHQLDFAHNFHKGFNVPIVWAVRKDGELCSLTYEPDQEVLAWARHLTGHSGEFFFGYTACGLDSEPIQQTVEFESCYTYIEGVGDSLGSANTAGQFHVIPGPVANALATAGIRSGFLIAYPPEEDEWQVIKIDGDQQALATPVPLPAGHAFSFAPQEGQAGCSGHSDVLCYLLVGSYDIGAGNVNAQVFFNWETQTAYAMAEPEALLKKWCKRGNDLYRFGGFPDATIVRWDMTNPVMSDPEASRVAVDYSLRDIFRTEDKLWTLGADGFIRELNPSTLDEIASHDTGITSPTGIIGFYPVSDTRFYILWVDPSVGNPAHFYVFELPGETLTQLDADPGISGSCPHVSIAAGFADHSTLQFASGFFYFNHGGDAGGTSAGRLGPILCPGGESIYGGLDFLL